MCMLHVCMLHVCMLHVCMFVYKLCLFVNLQVKSSAIFLHDTTVIPPFPLLFFGGDISVTSDGDQENIAVDDWIRFQAPAHLAQMVKV